MENGNSILTQLKLNSTSNSVIILSHEGHFWREMQFTILFYFILFQSFFLSVWQVFYNY